MTPAPIKKPKRREAVYTMKQISEAMGTIAMLSWEWDAVKRELRRIAARKRKAR